jgi:hypothetical protein
MADSERSAAMPDDYDRQLGMLDGAQAVTKTRPAMVRTVPPLGIGGSATYSVTSYRQAGDIIEEDPDTGNVKRGPATFTVFLEVAKADKLTRIVVPEEVFMLMSRQRDSLISQAQRRAGKAVAERRKARGEKPGFMKGRKS